MRKTSALLFALLSFAACGLGAVTLDNYQVGSNNNGTGAISWTHTNGCSVKCIGYVLLSSLSSPTPTFTWGGSAMTLATSHARSYGANGPGTLYIYCIVNPPSGAATIASTATAWLIADSVTLSGAKQSCTPDATQFTENASYSGTLVPGFGYLYPAAISPATANSYVIAMFSAAEPMTTTMAGSGVYRMTTNLYSDFFVWDAGGTVTGAYTLNAGSSVATFSYSVLVMSVAPVAPPAIKSFMLVIP